MTKTPIFVFVAASFVKLLLVPAYRSTDFEVHRNWLAVTHSLPLSKWYYEDTSEWTLDYPPFFARFEWALSQLAARVDPLIVVVENLGYAAESCVLFQRVSVMVCDLTLLYAVVEFCKYHGNRSHVTKHKAHDALILSLLILFNYGLIIVDHVHFQYNGFLFGFLLLSLTRLLQSRFLEGAFYFAVLLNLKHIFLYIAPAYFVFLLKSYCFSGDTALRNFSLSRFLKLGSVVVATFLVSFGPFIYMGQLGQVISRLFPFKRGLCHAYWAPNVWALYSFADKLLAAAGVRLGLVSSNSTTIGAGMTSGLVGEMQLQALPDIVPMATAVFTLLAMMPALLRLWLRPASPVELLKTVLACAYASFLFGWHVHEKAIMMITLPLCLLVLEERQFARIFLVLSTSGHVSLFPLLFRPAETPIKLSLFLLYTVLGFLVLPTNKTSTIISSEPQGDAAVKTELHKPAADSSKNKPLAKRGTSFHLSSFVDASCFALLCVVQFYCLFVHTNFVFFSRYEFLPLLLTSVSCALGVVWSWILFCKATLLS